jgi:hypothetical protein
VDPLRPVSRTEPAVPAVEPTILTPIEREQQRRERERKRREREKTPKKPADAGDQGLDVRV